MAVRGLQQISNNLRRVKQKMAINKRAALTRVGFIVKADAVKNAPIDTGNLRGSGYTDVKNNSVVVGFTAAYAPFVHENLEANFKKGGPKFLENSVNDNRDRILDELARGGLF